MIAPRVTLIYGLTGNGRARPRAGNIRTVRRVYVLEVQSLAFGPSKGTAMTQSTTETTAAAPMPTGQDKGLFARAVGIIVAPRQTFEAIAARPRSFGMLVFTIVMTAVLTGGFMFTAVGQQAFLDMMERRGGTAQSMQVMEKIAPYMGYITIGQLADRHADRHARLRGHPAGGVHAARRQRLLQAGVRRGGAHRRDQRARADWSSSRSTTRPAP